MTGGGHHEPPVLTHFLPGMVAGIVLGAITGTLFVANLASESLRVFWQESHEAQERAAGASEVCGDAGDITISSQVSSTGGTLTSIIVGNGEETLVTIGEEYLRFVPAATHTHAYLAVVASESQQEAFPATSLYRVDYCEKSLTLVLGGTHEPASILGTSPSGAWVLFATDTLRLMNTREQSVTALSATAEAVERALFAPTDKGGAIEMTNGMALVWSVAGEGGSLREEVVGRREPLVAWTLQSPQEYLANIK